MVVVTCACKYIVASVVVFGEVGLVGCESRAGYLNTILFTFQHQANGQYLSLAPFIPFKTN